MKRIPIPLDLAVGDMVVCNDGLQCRALKGDRWPGPLLPGGLFLCSSGHARRWTPRAFEQDGRLVGDPKVYAVRIIRKAQADIKAVRLIIRSKMSEQAEQTAFAAVRLLEAQLLTAKADLRRRKTDLANLERVLRRARKLVQRF